MPNISGTGRATVVLLAGLLALSGCGGDDGDEAGTGAVEPPGDPTSTDPTGADDADACVEVTHELGTTCVPADPQRVVALDSFTVLPTLLELGVPVVASSAVYSVGAPFPAYLDPADTAGIELVGDLLAPNVEAIAAARPDLIIGSSAVVEPLRSELEAIAPVVATRYAYYESTWTEDVRLVGEAVGRVEEVDASLAVLDERIEEVRATLEGRGSSLELTRIDIFAGAPVYYRFGCTWFGQVLGAVGITQPEAQGPEDCADGSFESVLVYPSPEELGVLEADVIVAYQQQAAGDDVGADPLATLEANPVWATLGPVESGRVLVVDDAWGLGGSITSALEVLDDIETTVFPADG